MSPVSVESRAGRWQQRWWLEHPPWRALQPAPESLWLPLFLCVASLSSCLAFSLWASLHHGKKTWHPCELWEPRVWVWARLSGCRENLCLHPEPSEMLQGGQNQLGFHRDQPNRWRVMLGQAELLIRASSATCIHPPVLNNSGSATKGAQ